MDPIKFKLQVDPYSPQKSALYLEGENIVGMSLQLRYDELPKMVLELDIIEGTAEGEVVMAVTPETYRQLVKLGWAPPGKYSDH